MIISNVQIIPLYHIVIVKNSEITCETEFQGAHMHIPQFLVRPTVMVNAYIGIVHAFLW